MKYDLLLCGVGGQGIITLSEILATAAISKGLKTIVTQDRGLAQRGGSVKAHVRLGDVHSPMIPKGHAHALLSMELGETLGYLDYLNPDTVVVASTTLIGGAGALGKDGGKSDEQADARQLVPEIGGRARTIEAEARAAELGVPRAANIYLLGAVFGLDPRIRDLVDPEELAAAIRSVVRKTPEQNVAVFRSGMQDAREGR